MAFCKSDNVLHFHENIPCICHTKRNPVQNKLFCPCNSFPIHFPISFQIQWHFLDQYFSTLFPTLTHVIWFLLLSEAVYPSGSVTHPQSTSERIQEFEYPCSFKQIFLLVILSTHSSDKYHTPCLSTNHSHPIFLFTDYDGKFYQEKKEL